MMKNRLLALVGLLTLALATCALAADEQTSPASKQKPWVAGKPPAGAVRNKGTVLIPASSKPTTGKMHTNLEIFVPPSGKVVYPNLATSPEFYETPASLGCVYNVGPQYFGCNPATGRTNHPVGGWGAIALVDAFDDPTAEADLKFFSASMGLPAPKFTKIEANTFWGDPLGIGFTASCSGPIPGLQNPDQIGWALEESLDIEWAHAMAPNAQIVLVEACSDFGNDLFFAELVAPMVVADLYGGGDISNSWAGGEDPGQLGDFTGLPARGWDNLFYRFADPNIIFFASAGDVGWGALYPSTNPWVVSAGGTSVYRDQTGNYLAQGCWGNFTGASGGGPSAIEVWQDVSIVDGPGPWANYQYQLFGSPPDTTFTHSRDTPDIAFDADPLSGVYVYDSSYPGGPWLVVGGTSVSSPALAGIINNANNRFSQWNQDFPGYFTPEEHNYIYSQQDAYTAFAASWTGVYFGSNGAPGPPFGEAPPPGVGVNYNECTGLGTPLGKLGK